MEKEFVIKSGGLYVREITERSLDFNEAVISKLQGLQSLKINRIIPMAALEKDAVGHANVIINSNGSSFWSLPVHQIRLETAFKNDGDLFYPSFDAEDKSSAVIGVEWKVPSNMHLTLMVDLNVHLECETQYFVAMQSGGNQYRLPLSNTYSDCKLCAGKYKQTCGSHLNAIAEAWMQFRKGQWQSDLYPGNNEATKALFSFKIVEDKMVQTWFEGDDWTVNCTKIGNEFLRKNILL